MYFSGRLSREASSGWDFLFGSTLSQKCASCAGLGLAILPKYQATEESDVYKRDAIGSGQGTPVSAYPRVKYLADIYPPRGVRLSRSVLDSTRAIRTPVQLSRSLGVPWPSLCLRLPFFGFHKDSTRVPRGSARAAG